MPKHVNTLTTVLGLFNSADAIVVDDSPVLTSWEFDSVEAMHSRSDDEVVYISWTGKDGLEFSAKLTMGGLADGHWDDQGRFVCEDHEGEQTTIQFFKLEPLSGK